MNWYEEIRADLHSRSPRNLPSRAPGRPAAVLIPLFVKEGELHLLLTRRSEEVETHKGQISFPGGAFETGDGDLQRTALREAEEEVGLDRRAVIVLGRLDERIVVTGYRVTPFVGAVPYPFDWEAEPSEIDEVFELPLALFLDPRLREERLIDVGGTPHPVLYYHVGERPVWGATARMIEDLLACITTLGARPA